MVLMQDLGFRIADLGSRIQGLGVGPHTNLKNNASNKGIIHDYKT